MSDLAVASSSDEDVRTEIERERDPAAEHSYWQNQLKAARKSQEVWEKRVGTIHCLYLDEDQNGDPRKGDGRYNVLWSNMETLFPAVYARPPVPEVMRRHKDSDPLAKEAATVLERAVDTELDTQDFEDNLGLSVHDYLLIGRGQVWVRLESEFQQIVDPVTQVVQESIARQQTLIEQVAWDDFLHGPAPKWEQVPWVARRTWMTKEEFRGRFGEELAAKLKAQTIKASQQGGDKKADPGYGEEWKGIPVWEIWDKAKRRVLWHVESYSEGPLEISEPFLDLKGFFPCPKPMLATHRTNSLVPVPDYVLYQDQVNELNKLTARIDALTVALKVAGARDGSSDELDRLLSEGFENKLVPVESWAAFAEKGGLQGAISFLPILEVAQVLERLVAMREQVKQDLYEISGLSDILRGASEAVETATAQRIKGQFASVRIEDRRKAVARFARDAIRIAAEIVSEHYDPQILLDKSGYAQMVNAQLQAFPQIAALLRNDKMRRFRIGIETDSTVAVDQDQERQTRIDFLSTMTPFLEQAAQMVRGAPAIAPLVGQMIMFAVQGFKVGRGLESQFQEAVDQMVQQAIQAAQAPPQPTIEERELEFEQQKAMADHMIDRGKLQVDAAKAMIQEEGVQANALTRLAQIMAQASRPQGATVQ